MQSTGMYIMDELVRGDGRKTGQRHAAEEIIITNDNPIINFFHALGVIMRART